MPRFTLHTHMHTRVCTQAPTQLRHQVKAWWRRPPLGDPETQKAWVCTWLPPRAGEAWSRLDLAVTVCTQDPEQRLEAKLQWARLPRLVLGYTSHGLCRMWGVGKRCLRALSTTGRVDDH